ncbi:MAG: hypothetical protein ACR2OR_10480 [Hyphomicrobiales bacterium]
MQTAPARHAIRTEPPRRTTSTDNYRRPGAPAHRAPSPEISPGLSEVLTLLKTIEAAA